MAKIAIMGAGVYGTALGGILANNGLDVDYYDPLKEQERLKDVLDGARAVLLCVPSETALKLLPYIPDDKFLIVATKGFLSAKPFEKFKDFAVMSGAGFAKDIKAKKLVYLTTTERKVAEMFYSEQLIFDYSDDVKGVLMCGALKNVYALLAGKRGLKPKTQKMDTFINAASNEMGMILQANGCKLSTLRLNCGLKDLILTCAPESRNYSYGMALRNNPNAKPEATAESLTTLKHVLRGEIIVPDTASLLKGLWKELGDAKC